MTNLLNTILTSDLENQIKKKKEIPRHVVFVNVQSNECEKYTTNIRDINNIS